MKVLIALSMLASINTLAQANSSHCIYSNSTLEEMDSALKATKEKLLAGEDIHRPSIMLVRDIIQTPIYDKNLKQFRRNRLIANPYTGQNYKWVPLLKQKQDMGLYFSSDRPQDTKVTHTEGFGRYFDDNVVNYSTAEKSLCTVLGPRQESGDIHSCRQFRHYISSIRIETEGLTIVFETSPHCTTAKDFKKMLELNGVIFDIFSPASDKACYPVMKEEIYSEREALAPELEVGV